MKRHDAVTRARSRLLQAVFGILYTRLGGLHELAGSVAYGPAWSARRHLVLPTKHSGYLLDIGCGEGRLIAKLFDTPFPAIGIEPSAQMTSRAHRRGASVIRASAQALPLQDGTITHVIATWPGPWIIDTATWNEIARVTSPGASVAVLIGGDIRRGRGASIRRRLLHLIYGAGDIATDTLPRLGNAQIEGDYQCVEDNWGTSIIWRGERLADP